jgi:hypothetical protein
MHYVKSKALPVTYILVLHTFYHFGEECGGNCVHVTSKRT